VIFIGNDLAKDIFGNDDPIGREIKVFSTPFTVIGVLAPKIQDSSYSGRDKDKAFIPSTTFQSITGEKYAHILIYKSFKPRLNNALTEEIRAILGKNSILTLKTLRQYRFGILLKCSLSLIHLCLPSLSFFPLSVLLL